MRAILVPVADSPECAIALRTAFLLAGDHDANVVGYHLRPHDQEKPKTIQSLPFLQKSYGDWQSSLADKTVQMDSQAAKKFFDARVKEHGFDYAKSPRYKKGGRLALWHEMKGSPERVMSIIGPLSDLIVVSRPEKLSSARARSFMLCALTLSGRPVLILPKRRIVQIGTRIMIAWNQSPEAAAAVSAAMPLLEKAKEVNIVVCGKEHPTGPQARHLQQYLRYWNIKSTVRQTPGKSTNDEIIETYGTTMSDLLVMGAYSRPQWRETLFGGVTQEMITKTKIPVFMLHR